MCTLLFSQYGYGDKVWKAETSGEQSTYDGDEKRQHNSVNQPQRKRPLT